MSKFKQIGIPTIVLTVICIIVTALLAGTNVLTKNTIEKSEKAATEKAMQSLAPSGSKFSDGKADTIKYDGDEFDFTVYTAKSDNETASVYIVDGKGYGGTVEVMTCISDKGEILGVDVLDVSDETVGLGQDTDTKKFENQFKNKDSEQKVQKDGGEIDAITGATISSRSVTNCVNAALEAFNGGAK